MRFVRYDRFAGIDGLTVEESPEPTVSAGHVLVQLVTSCLNPGAIAALKGSAFVPVRDVAGIVVEVGDDVTDFYAGQQVLGWLQDWAAHADVVAIPAQQLVSKPSALNWEIAGSMFFTPMAGRAGVVAVQPQRGETVLVAGASGGVGYTSAQLARRTGATVVGVASEAHHARLIDAGIVPVAYGPGIVQGISAATDGKRVDAVIDAVGSGYVDMALELGVTPARTNTVVDFAAAKSTGASTYGTMQAGGIQGLTELVELAASEELDIPIDTTFPIENVQDAYRHLAAEKPAGRVVLRFNDSANQPH